MSSPWRPNKDEREAILYLEALGLIHDLGKLSDKFLQSQAKDKDIYGVKYFYRRLVDPRHVFPNHTGSTVEGTTATIREWQRQASSQINAPFIDRPDLTGILQHLEITNWDLVRYNLGEMSLLANRPKNTEKDWTAALEKNMSPALLVAALHGIAHFEKEDAPDDNSQPYQEMHRATPFGSEDPILVDTPAAALKSLPLDRLSKIVTPERRRWLADMRGCMAQGIADTRRPQNDITLWDWGYTVASLTKAAAAWLFKTKPESLDFTRRDWLAWRTLRVSLDILGLYQQSDTIRDLLGIGDALKKSFEAVQTLLEETYALANRFYHDETGAYYLFPNFDRDDELLQEIRGCFPPDLQPQIHLEAPVNGAQLDPWNKTYDYVEAAANLVANPRKSALKIRQEPVQWDNNLYSWGKEWLKDRPPNAEICTVCGFRPVGYPPKNSEAEATLEPELASWATFDKAKERNLCRVCLTRRGRRSQEWAERSFQGTVWTSEVADNHGRLALLVGRLGLEGWLDGVLFSTIMIKGDSPKAPSPTRLYRVAETGRRFWERAWNVIAPAVVNHRRTFRLALHPEDAAWDWLTAKLGPYHAYELQWEGKTLEVVWDAPRSRFVTVENLEYFVKRHKLKDEEWIEKLGQAKCQLREPGTAGRKSQPLNSVQIIKYEKLDAYVPVIPLLAEPMVGLSLVPADKALDLVQAICRAYMDQMARVRDRLPLHLGLVFFPRRAPMRAVLEAGRAMLKMGDKKVEEWWGIVQAETVNDKRRLIFDNGVVWEVPLCSGDGTVLDKWYPHFRFCPSIQNEPPIIESKHVKDLKARDSKTPPDKRPKVCISPSRFDFEFLDITGRRFEISYDVSGRRWSRPTRPFLLDNLDRLEALWKQMQDLSITQRYQVVQAIEATREAWFGQDGRLALLEKDEEKGTFRQFVRDTLAGAAWRKTSWEKISPEIRQQLEDAGVTGELADLAELHLQILKEKESKGADNHGDF